jgi:phosphate transport system substrate-binding protein
MGEKMKSRLSLAVSLLTVTALIAGTSPASAAGTINGSGATFAAPLIDACKGDFTAATQNIVNYPGGGSSKGRTDFAAGNLVNFAGSDAPYSSGEPANIIYAPIFAAPISLMYNVKGIKEGLYLSPATIAKIFSGQITVWNDPAIDKDNTRTVKTPVFATKKVTTKVKGKSVTNTVPVLDAKGNPKVLRYTTKVIDYALPQTAITVWYRTDGSGTTENFGKFLHGTAPSIWTKDGAPTFTASTPKSIAGAFNFQGQSGSAAVAASVAGQDGSIGYGELNFALANKLPSAFIQNTAGEFVEPTAAGTSAFLGGGKINANGTLTVDFKKKIPGAYSLGTASYGLAYPAASKKDPEKQKDVAAWFTYLLDECPVKFPQTGFSKITGPLYTKAKAQIALIK